MPEIKCDKMVNPLDPNSAEKLQEMEERIRRETHPENLVTAEDLHDESATAFLKHRPLSAGVLAILEQIKSPFLHGTAEPTLSDIMVVLFLLYSDTDRSRFPPCWKSSRGPRMFIPPMRVKKNRELDHRLSGCPDR